MKTLKLVLKGRFYHLIESGQRNEEYRDITDYWIRRICRNWDNYFRGHYCVFGCNCIDFCGKKEKHIAHDFDAVTFYLGYAKDRPSMTFRVDDITIGEGRPEWGAIPNQRYFIIKLGERIK